MLTIIYLNDEGVRKASKGYDHFHFGGKPNDMLVIGVKQTDKGLMESFVTKAKDVLAIFDESSEELNEVGVMPSEEV